MVIDGTLKVSTATPYKIDPFSHAVDKRLKLELFPKKKNIQETNYLITNCTSNPLLKVLTEVNAGDVCFYTNGREAQDRQKPRSFHCFC